MSAAPKDKPQRKGGHGAKSKDATSRPKDSVSTASCMDDPGHHDENSQMAVSMENTYQLGPSKRFPISAVTDILKDVLTSYLQQEKYEVEWARQMTKTLCEVIRARVKEYVIAREKKPMVPRFKTVIQVHIGQLTGQGMQISSRCLWDAATDTFVSYSVKNSSLFGVANVFAVYFE